MTALSLYGKEAQNRPDWKALRGNGKATNFALCYGGSGNAVSRSTGVDQDEGRRIKATFDKTYKGLSKWWAHQHIFARKHGFVLTDFGRKYPVPDIHLPRIDPQTGRKNGGFIAKAQRNSVNGPVQGSSADITKLAMALIYKACRDRGWLDKVHMLLTMHDELVFEIDKGILKEAIDVLVECMAYNPVIMRRNWIIPLTVDVELGYDWTVPWDLNQIKRSGKWPEELKDLFDESKVVSEEPEPEIGPNKVEPVYAKNPPVTKVKIKELTPRTVEKLAIAIFGSRDDQGTFLHLELPDIDVGSSVESLWGKPFPEALKVNLDKFFLLAEDLVNLEAE